MVNIDGRKISAPQRGLNIVKLSDGSYKDIDKIERDTMCLYKLGSSEIWSDKYRK